MGELVGLVWLTFEIGLLDLRSGLRLEFQSHYRQALLKTQEPNSFTSLYAAPTGLAAPNGVPTAA